MSTIQELQKKACINLSHLETPSLDCEVLLSFVLQKPREYILAHAEAEVSPEQEKQFNDLLSQRAKHKPIAYLTKHKEFYGRDFYVDERVHIPRPATEDMIDFIKKNVPGDFSGTMADIGTGSGCIAITLALEFPQAKIIATDISEDALNVTKQNVASLNAKIDFYNGDLLDALPGPVDIIVSNPPYGWAEGWPAGRSFSEVWSDDQETKQQPPISYESGFDGLDAIRQIIKKLPDYLNPGGQAFIEFDPRQNAAIQKLAQATGFKCSIIKDLSSFDRIAHLWYK